MNPQPPVTRMRMAARTSSAERTALVESPPAATRIGSYAEQWKSRFAGVDWVPWLIIRSEEHTSELQSRVDLVCRLLLEKKNYYKSRIGVYRVVFGYLPAQVIDCVYMNDVAVV